MGMGMRVGCGHPRWRGDYGRHTCSATSDAGDCGRVVLDPCATLHRRMVSTRRTSFSSLEHTAVRCAGDDSDTATRRSRLIRSMQEADVTRCLGREWLTTRPAQLRRKLLNVWVARDPYDVDWGRRRLGLFVLGAPAGRGFRRCTGCYSQKVGSNLSAAFVLRVPGRRKKCNGSHAGGACGGGPVSGIRTTLVGDCESVN